MRLIHTAGGSTRSHGSRVGLRCCDGGSDLIGQCHRYPSGLQRWSRYACCGREEELAPNRAPALCEKLNLRICGQPEAVDIKLFPMPDDCSVRLQDRKPNADRGPEDTPEPSSCSPDCFSSPLSRPLEQPLDCYTSHCAEPQPGGNLLRKRCRTPRSRHLPAIYLAGAARWR